MLDTLCERRASRRVHCVGHNIEPITEQVAVLVERHGRRLMAQHLLNHLDVSPGGDSQ